MKPKKLAKRLIKGQEMAPIARALAEAKAQEEGVSLDRIMVMGTRKGKLIAVKL